LEFCGNGKVPLFSFEFLGLYYVIFRDIDGKRDRLEVFESWKFLTLN